MLEREDEDEDEDEEREIDAVESALLTAVRSRLDGASSMSIRRRMTLEMGLLPV